MAAYDTLRAAIDSYIKANGNKEITGTVLNDILNAMVSALGADTRFAGVAVPTTNPGNPEGNVVYFASQAGTYSNFGGIVLPLGIHILVWNGTAWTSQTWFSVDNTPTQNSQNLATSGGILQAIVDAVGMERLRAIGAEVTSCSFDSNTKKISFFNSADDTLFQLDATAFVIDGMVSDVKIEDGNLVIQFNTDAGKQDIEIPLTDIFNPTNYYTKTAIDALLALYYTKTETDALLTAINNKLADGCLYRGMAEPTTNPPTPTTKVFYIATKAGTYTNFGNIAVTEGITILKYDGSNWSKEQISYSDGVFDISAYNGTSYANLSAALGTDGANIPQNLRKGGMSVKFVQSSDNKYVQYRLMSDTFSTIESDWQGVDDIPTAGSNNLAKSDGVYYGLSELKFSVDNNIPFTQGYYLNKNGNLNADGNGYYTDFIEVRQGDSFLYNGEARYSNPAIYVMYSADKTVISYENTEKVYVDETITVSNSNVKYIRFGSYITAPSCKKILSVPSNVELKENINTEKNKTDNIFLNSFNIGKDIANDLSIAVQGKYVDKTTGVLIDYSPYNIYQSLKVCKGGTISIKNALCSDAVALISYYDSATDSYTPIVIGTNTMSDYDYTFEKDGYIRLCYNVDASTEIQIIYNTFYGRYADGIKQEDTLFLNKQVSPNLFDKTKVTSGYISWNNQITPSDDFCVSDYIPVENGKTYIYPCYPNFFGDGADAILLFNENKEKLEYVHSGSIANGLNTITINNASAKYVRVNVANVISSNITTKYEYTLDMFMFVEDSVYPQIYSPFGIYYQTNSTIIYNSLISKLNPLWGKEIVFAGDSICNGSSAEDGKSGYAGRIGRKNNMLWENKAIGGGTFTDRPDWETFVISDTDFGTSPDYIIIEGGVNDADRDTNRTYLGTSDPADYTSTFTNDTFCGALDYMFKRIANNYPNAKVGFIVAQKMHPTNSGYTADVNNIRFFFEKAIEIAKKWGIPSLDLWNDTMLNPSIPSFYTQGSTDNYYVDGQHLTAKGYDYISSKIEEWIKTL